MGNKSQHICNGIHYFNKKRIYMKIYMKKVVLTMALTLIFSANVVRAKTTCSVPVNSSNYVQVLTSIITGIAERSGFKILNSKFFGLNGTIVTNNVHKSAAFAISRTSDGRELKYTILVEDNCVIGGFGSFE